MNELISEFVLVNDNPDICENWSRQLGSRLQCFSNPQHLIEEVKKDPELALRGKYILLDRYYDGMDLSDHKYLFEKIRSFFSESKIVLFSFRHSKGEKNPIRGIRFDDVIRSCPADKRRLRKYTDEF